MCIRDSNKTDSDISPTPPLHFTWGQKVRNLDSIFDPIRLTCALDSKWSNVISEIKHVAHPSPNLCSEIWPKFGIWGAVVSKRSNTSKIWKARSECKWLTFQIWCRSFPQTPRTRSYKTALWKTRRENVLCLLASAATPREKYIRCWVLA